LIIVCLVSSARAFASSPPSNECQEKKLVSINLDDRAALSSDIAALRCRVAELEQQLADCNALAVHDKARRDAERRAWNQRLALHMQRTPLAYIEWNVDFEVVEWNPAAETIFGYSKAEALGRHAAGLIVPAEIRPLVDQVWADLLTRSGGVRSSNDNVTKAGTVIACEWYNTPLVAEDGSVLGVVSLVQDVTARKHAEEVARLNEERIRTITSNLPVILFAIDQNGVFTLSDGSVLNRLGLEPGQIVGQPVDAVYAGMPDILAYVRRALAGETINAQLAIGDALFETWYTPTYATDGTCSGMLGVSFDMTPLKRAQAEAQRLQDEMIQMQAATLAELSTPLIPISDDIVVMPLIGAIDSQRVQQVLHTLLNGVGSTLARAAILDITGVSVVDTQVANTLVQAAQAVGLLGARVVLTGIRPEVAQTLVGLGVNLGSIVTHSSLQSGIAYASGRN
jgi:rsbT co-antagonist protein RsbR